MWGCPIPSNHRSDFCSWVAWLIVTLVVTLTRISTYALIFQSPLVCAFHVITSPLLCHSATLHLPCPPHSFLYLATPSWLEVHNLRNPSLRLAGICPLALRQSFRSQIRIGSRMKRTIMSGRCE